MYNVLDKDIIKSEIVPYLPLAKRDFQATGYANKTRSIS
jgi:hypothetical protein